MTSPLERHAHSQVRTLACFASFTTVFEETRDRSQSDLKHDILQSFPQILFLVLISGRQTKASDRGGKRQKLIDFNKV